MDLLTKLIVLLKTIRLNTREMVGRMEIGPSFLTEDLSPDLNKGVME